MILSTLWTEKICIQPQSKIWHHALILLLHYLAQITGVYVTTEALCFHHIAFQQRVKKINNSYQKCQADTVSK